MFPLFNFTLILCGSYFRKTMQRLQLFILLLYFSVSIFAEFLDDSFYRLTLTKICENQLFLDENCTENHVTYQESEALNVTLYLKLYNEDYSVPLHRHKSPIFSPDAKVTIENSNESYNLTNSIFFDLSVYEGTDVNGTYVCGYVHNHVFSGFLMLKNGSSIYIDYFMKKNNSSLDDDVSLMVYKANDVKFKTCSFLDGRRKCSENGFSSSLNCIRETKRKTSCYLGAKESENSSRPHFAADQYPIKSAKQPPLFSTKKASCNVLITVDASYYVLHNQDPKIIMTNLVLAIKQVNHILSFMDFDEDGQPDGVSLKIRDVVLKASTNNTYSNSSMYSEDNLSNLVDDFRKMPQDECMSLMFVSLPMNSNLLSVAYAGGVCKSNDKESEPAKNVAVINTVDSTGKSMAFFATAWAVAMAVGQVMGSAEKACDKKSHFPPEDDWKAFFSECERHNIANILQRQGSCLEFPDGEMGLLSKPQSKVPKTLCGNGQVNFGEECDCGTEQDCKRKNSCCVPPGKENECQYDRSKGYECDWVDDCCTKDCKIIPKTWNNYCGYGDSRCALEGAYCNGKSPHCPVPKSAASLKDGDPCGPSTLKLAGAATCKQGLCNSTVCQDAGLQDCMCPPSSGQQCRVCCLVHGTKQKEGDEGVCVPAEYFRMKPKKGRFFHRHPGTPCSEVQFGHCDKFGKCDQFSNFRESGASAVVGSYLLSIFSLFIPNFVLYVL